MAKEIWFKCIKCGKEAYCDIYFEKIPEAEVMCPFCLHRMKLKDARISGQ
jgi:DNA-directed RNA polymerase subunit RPC12/RpoP